MCRKPLVPLVLSHFTCRKGPSLLGLSHLHGLSTPFLHFTHAPFRSWAPVRPVSNRKSKIENPKFSKPLVPLAISHFTCNKAPSLLEISHFRCRKSPSLLALSHLHTWSTPFLRFTRVLPPLPGIRPSTLGVLLPPDSLAFDVRPSTFDSPDLPFAMCAILTHGTLAHLEHPFFTISRAPPARVNR